MNAWFDLAIAIVAEVAASTALPATQYPRKSIVNQPGVKAVHIANPSGKGAWEGLNVYEANDEVRIYVVPAEGSGKRKGR